VICSSASEEEEEEEAVRRRDVPRYPDDTPTSFTPPVGARPTFACRFRFPAAERRHPAGRERMGSPTLQTHKYPILLLPSSAAFQTLR
jgi:hypothetical protein